jgi:small subunit ribosomal protein S17
MDQAKQEKTVKTNTHYKGHIFVGTVASVKMLKTIIVQVVQSTKHPLYQKMMKHTKKFAVHIEDTGVVAVGDRVKIHEIKPVSKTKHFEFVEKITK